MTNGTDIHLADYDIVPCLPAFRSVLPLHQMTFHSFFREVNTILLWATIAEFVRSLLLTLSVIQPQATSITKMQIRQD